MASPAFAHIVLWPAAGSHIANGRYQYGLFLFVFWLTVDMEFSERRCRIWRRRRRRREKRNDGMCNVRGKCIRYARQQWRWHRCINGDYGEYEWIEKKKRKEQKEQTTNSKATRPTLLVTTKKQNIIDRWRSNYRRKQIQSRVSEPEKEEAKKR